MKNIVGGKWLTIRDNYDREMCKVNHWECVQDRHFDCMINGNMVEVKKTKSTGTIIKLQQLAEIILSPELQNIEYLIIRTNIKQTQVQAAFLIPALELCGIVGMSEELAKKTLDVHQAFGCTIQNTLRQKKIEQFQIQ